MITASLPCLVRCRSRRRRWPGRLDDVTKGLLLRLQTGGLSNAGQRIHCYRLHVQGAGTAGVQSRHGGNLLSQVDERNHDDVHDDGAI